MSAKMSLPDRCALLPCSACGCGSCNNGALAATAGAAADAGAETSPCFAAAPVGTTGSAAARSASAINAFARAVRARAAASAAASRPTRSPRGDGSRGGSWAVGSPGFSRKAKSRTNRAGAVVAKAWRGLPSSARVRDPPERPELSGPPGEPPGATREFLRSISSGCT